MCPVVGVVGDWRSWVGVGLSTLALAGCEQEPQGELTRSQCKKLVEKIVRVETSDSAVEASRDRRQETEIRQCLKNGTQRAYSCYMTASTRRDLSSCKALMKQ